MLFCSSDSAWSKVLPVWRRNAINENNLTLSLAAFTICPAVNALKTQRLCLRVGRLSSLPFCM